MSQDIIGVAVLLQTFWNRILLAQKNACTIVGINKFWIIYEKNIGFMCASVLCF